MENAAYIGLSRQMTLRRELDIAANNIANANTTGFKVEQLLLGTEVGNRARNEAVGPGVSFVLDQGVGRDFSQGSLQQTGRDLVKRRSIRIVSGTVAIGRKHDRAAAARDTLPLGQRDGRCRGEDK